MATHVHVPGMTYRVHMHAEDCCSGGEDGMREISGPGEAAAYLSQGRNVTVHGVDPDIPVGGKVLAPGTVFEFAPPIPLIDRLEQLLASIEAMGTSAAKVQAMQIRNVIEGLRQIWSGQHSSGSEAEDLETLAEAAQVLRRLIAPARSPR